MENTTFYEPATYIIMENNHKVRQGDREVNIKKQKYFSLYDLNLIK